MNYKKLFIASFICASILSVSSAYSQELQAKVAKGGSVNVYKKYASIDKMIEYKNKSRLWFIRLISNPITDSKKAVKESFELVDHRLLLVRSGTATAETRDRRHQFIDIRSSGLDLVITESVLQELFSSSRFELCLSLYVFRCSAYDTK